MVWSRVCTLICYALIISGKTGHSLDTVNDSLDALSFNLYLHNLTLETIALQFQQLTTRTVKDQHYLCTSIFLKAHLSVLKQMNKCISPEVSIVNHFRHLPCTYFLFHVFCISTACAYCTTHTLVRIIIAKRIYSIHPGQTQGTKSSSCCN